jgi:diadenosine tetraphosphate (Ap4A) HIT family hydrolase
MDILFPPCIPSSFPSGMSLISSTCNDLLQKTKDTIKEEDNTVVGFNVGVNVGEAAGQTIFHCHIHLIPRRKGDVENPCGGVRHVMPGKGYYRVDT